MAAAIASTALVLAAGRRGAEDSVARMQNKSHKCLVEIDGRVMLERVVEALLDSGPIDRVLVSIEREDLLGASERLEGWLAEGRMVFAQSRETLADSVVDAARGKDGALPLIVTTGDNVLHTPEFLREFAELGFEQPVIHGPAVQQQQRCAAARPAHEQARSGHVDPVAGSRHRHQGR